MQVELYHVVLKNLPDDNFIDYICGPFGTYTEARNKVDELERDNYHRTRYYSVMGSFIELHEV